FVVDFCFADNHWSKQDPDKETKETKDKGNTILFSSMVTGSIFDFFPGLRWRLLKTAEYISLSLSVATRSMSVGTTQVQAQLPGDWCLTFSGAGDGAVPKKPANSRNVKQSGGRKSGQFSSSPKFPQAQKKPKK
ncbi:hypothetical protein BaRGS_00030416, partial [Batillaria attramentaria]